MSDLIEKCIKEVKELELKEDDIPMLIINQIGDFINDDEVIINTTLLQELLFESKIHNTIVERLKLWN